MSGLAGSIMWAGQSQRGERLRGVTVKRGPWALWFDGALYRSQHSAGDVDDAKHALDEIERVGLDAALERGLDGDFAFALFDNRTQTLHLVRDRFGIRPLYYAKLDGGVAFGSRARQLARLRDDQLQPRSEFVTLYAASHYRTFDDDETASPWVGVQQAPAASVVRISPHGETTRRYWQVREAPEPVVDERSLAETLRELLQDAVARRLARSQRPVFTLSGGMDSSSVLFVASHVMNGSPRALSAVYDHEEYDESADIRESLAGAATTWSPIAVSNVLDVRTLEQAIEANEEPLPTATWLAHYELCQAAKSLGASEMFDGLGGDELNAGEYEYFPYYFADLEASGDAAAFAHEIECWSTLHDHPIYRKSHDTALAMIARMTDRSTPGRCVPNVERIRRYADVLEGGGAAWLRSFMPRADHPFMSWLKNRTWQDLTRETMPCCLRASERNTAAAGMVNRSPFLDRALVEFMFSVPGRLKIRDGVTKRLLRTAMKGILPEATRTRVKKVGWNAPSDRWFVGKGADLMRDIIASQRFRERGVYRCDRLRELINEHEMIIRSGQPRENHMMLLWQALNLDIWLRCIEDENAARSRQRGEGMRHSGKRIHDGVVAENAVADGVERAVASGGEVAR